MTTIVFGLSHKTAGIDLRERVAFNADTLPKVLESAAAALGLKEIVILSTCNRTEMYISTDPAASLTQTELIDWFCDYHAGLAEKNGQAGTCVARAELEPVLYIFEGKAAARHLFRVASGLESMMLGEPQIFGQLKTAYTTSRTAGLVGSSLDRLFRHAFTVAKRVRTQTAIGNNPVSVAYAAVSLAGRIFPDLKKCTALLIGAGETIDLVARHLQQRQIGQIVIANRTRARAEALATTLGGSAIGLQELGEHLHEADIVISSTGSALPVLGKGAVETALRKRRHKPMFIADIAVPRDVEAEVADIEDAYLYSIDDLQMVINGNVRAREDAARNAEHLIREGVDDFMYKIRSLESVHALRSLRGRAEEVRDAELSKALRQCGSGQDPEAVMRQLAYTLTNKLIHHPTVQVRRAHAEGRREASDWLRDLFQLPDRMPAVPRVENFPEEVPGADSARSRKDGTQP